MTYHEILSAVYGEQELDVKTLPIGQQIAWDILADLTDRRGLRQEFEQCDEDIQDEIFDTWVGIIDSHVGSK
jgi:hypothetical protein